MTRRIVHRVDVVAGPAQDPRPEEDRDAGQQQRRAEQQVENERSSARPVTPK